MKNKETLHGMAFPLLTAILCGCAAVPRPPADTLAWLPLDEEAGAGAGGARWEFLPARFAPDGRVARPADDAAFAPVAPDSLGEPRGPQELSLAWYRLRFTLPERIGGERVEERSAWLQLVVDDYAEVLVNGAFDDARGSSGAGAVSGFNTENLVRVTERARPGEAHEVLVLGVNAPLGRPPWLPFPLRNAVFFRRPVRLVLREAEAARPPPQRAPDPVARAEGSLPPGTRVEACPLALHRGPGENEIVPRVDALADASGCAPEPVLDESAAPRWLRMELTVPEKVGGVPTRGRSLWLRVQPRGYAEVWVEGGLDFPYGRGGRGAFSGLGAPQWARLAARAVPGDRVRVAVLDWPGPLSGEARGGIAAWSLVLSDADVE
jgi:hypothetical protein